MSTQPQPDPNAAVTGNTLFAWLTAIFTDKRIVAAFGALVAAILGVTASFFGAGGSIIPPVPTSATVLKSSQFKAAGYMLCPADKDPLSAGIPYLHYSQGIAVKRTGGGGGVRSFLLQGTPNKYWTGPGPNNGDCVVEIGDAGYGAVLASAPRAWLVRAATRAEVYGGDFPLGKAAGQYAFDGRRLVWVFADEYNTTSSDFLCYGESVLGANGTWMPQGAAKVGGPSVQGSKRIFGYVTFAPDGRVIGGAGTQSGDQQCAYSPGANVIDGTYGLTPLCYWPKSAPMPRDAYLTCPNVSPINGVIAGDVNVRLPANTWDAIGRVTAGAWIKTPTCEGLLLAGNVTAPGAVAWYGPGTIASTATPPLIDPQAPSIQGSHASARTPRCWIFSATDLAAVAAGTLSAGAIQPVETFDPRAVFGFSMIPEQGSISGLAWDATAQELFINTGCNGDSNGLGCSVLAKALIGP
jgi:hypothetical protein